jgi:hypothetical protein
MVNALNAQVLYLSDTNFNIVAYLLKAIIVKQAETAMATKPLCKHARF